MNNIEEVIRENGFYIGRIEGDSMMPMLDQRKDTVVVVRPKFPLKKYDVPVYRRDGHFTMHRIVKVRKDGYVICGDNRCFREYDITDNDIVGVLDSFNHNGKNIPCDDEEYIRYAKRICRTFYLRRFKYILKRISEKIR